MAEIITSSLYPIETKYNSNNLYNNIIIISVIKGKIADFIINLKRVEDNENL